MMSSSFAKHCQVTACAQVAAAGQAAAGALLCFVVLSSVCMKHARITATLLAGVICGLICVLILLLHAIPSFLELCCADLLQSAGEHELVCVRMHG